MQIKKYLITAGSSVVIIAVSVQASFVWGAGGSPPVTATTSNTISITINAASGGSTSLSAGTTSNASTLPVSSATSTASSSLPYIQPVSSSTPPSVLSVLIQNITDYSAEIVVKSNENVSVKASYNPLGFFQSESIYDTATSTDHILTLNGLDPETQYVFQLVLTNENGLQTLDKARDFRTLSDITPPVITHLHVFDITDRTVRFDFDTNKPANVTILYGSTPRLELGNLLVGGFDVTHSLFLSDLKPSTPYYLQVVVADHFGNSAKSTQVNFTTLADTFPPSNVYNALVNVMSTSTLIQWQNPPENDYAQTIVVRSPVTYPKTPKDGVVIFEGTSTSFVDSVATETTKHYFYTVFTKDSTGNVASGALAQPPGTPGFLVTKNSTIIDTGLTARVVRGSMDLQSGPLSVVATSQEGFHALSNTPLTLSVPASRVVKAVQSAYLTVDRNTYFLALNPITHAYEGLTITPVQEGHYPFTITFRYRDNTIEQIPGILVVDPTGTVYEIQDNKHIPVPNARIALYMLNSGTRQYDLWPAGSYHQVNPEMSGNDGSYAFFVPAGTYYIEVAKEGYLSYASKPFTVGNEAIHLDIQLMRPNSISSWMRGIMQRFASSSHKTIIEATGLITLVIVSLLILLL
ncbi:MAG: hypothetical protein KGI50_04670 [Patescibacteria group bacterium]|nr:hypothetical protein [Patescibacteria group bacterium]MDE2438669.1 hypothetical protein [Patescibacteria group bacterium]